MKVGTVVVTKGSFACNFVGKIKSVDRHTYNVRGIWENADKLVTLNIPKDLVQRASYAETYQFLKIKNKQVNKILDSMKEYYEIFGRGEYV